MNDKDFIASRFCVEIDVFDNETKKEVVCIGYNMNNKSQVIEQLKKAIALMEEIK